MKTGHRKGKIDFTESEIVRILREAHSAPVPDVASKHGITEAAIHAWHRKFGRLGAEDVKRLRHLKLQHVQQRTVPQTPGRPSSISEETQNELPSAAVAGARDLKTLP